MKIEIEWRELWRICRKHKDGRCDDSKNKHPEKGCNPQSCPLSKQKELTFKTLRATNVERCAQAFRPLHAWSPRDWALAMIGEAGETCNAIKKLRRYSTDLNISGNPGTEEDCIAKIAHEIADTIIYADLLAARLGIDLGKAIREKFNIVSDRVGSDVKL